jgi:SAM-dependent methyltransferase
MSNQETFPPWPSANRDMAAPVNLYDHAYGKYELDAYREVRIETYGEDLGQTSWVSAEESKQIPVWLNLALTSAVLEIGSGSGRYALRIAESVKCKITGLDINANHLRAVASGTVTATARPYHLGARSHVWSIEIRDERERLVCVSRLTMAIVERRPPV